MDQAKKCRVCLQNTTQITFSLKDIAPFQQIPYSEVYEYVTNCNFLSRGPGYLCWICMEDLLAAFEFKKRCERSEELFENEISLVKLESIESVVLEEDIRTKVGIEEERSLPEIDLKRKKQESHVKVESESDDQETFQSMSNVDDSQIECPFCSLCVSSNSSRLKHCKLKHQNKKRTCPEPNCNFEFFLPYQLSVHITRSHKTTTSETRETLAFKCTDCSESFQNNSLLRKHRRIIHDIKDPYSKNLNKEMTICAHCGKELSVSSVNSHIKNFHTDNESTFTCDLCGLSYKTRILLVCHMKRRHMEQISYHCRYCPEIFKNYATRRTHEIRFHTKDYRHFCQICDMKFIENTTLRKHMVTHTGDKNHICKECSARFGTMSALNRHIATHTDVKAFICHVCQAAFKTSKSLKSHFNVHQERKYQCPVCGQKFLINQQMRQHVKRNHPDFELPPKGTVMNKSARARLEQINLKKMQLSLVKNT